MNSLTIHLLYAITIVRVNTDVRPNEDDANVSATKRPSQVSTDQVGIITGMPHTVCDIPYVKTWSELNGSI